ncbi:MAG: class I SAM-dependent methyltransferase [Sterolibacterium sp.]|nr:class I SAM-dependent methyltransferase [Sterolibacterium sp.]MBP9799980.1 class I SAM-dependent methyltransferase [Sterolibacterium sp.]
MSRDRWVRLQAAAVQPGARVLDVGAGSCPYRSAFVHCEYRAQDFVGLQDEQLRHGKYGVIDYVCDASDIPVEDASFDVILCTEMLEHVSHPERIIAEFARILKPGGCLLLTAPLGSGLHQQPYHYYGGFTPFWYQKFLGEVGFECVVCEPNGHFFALFSQEAIRFMRLSWPLRLPLLPALLWWPFWLLLFPLLALLLPPVALWLDRYDTDRTFTIGYHVRAVRSGEAVHV